MIKRTRAQFASNSSHRSLINDGQAMKVDEMKSKTHIIGSKNDQTSIDEGSIPFNSQIPKGTKEAQNYSKFEFLTKLSEAALFIDKQQRPKQQPLQEIQNLDG